MQLLSLNIKSPTLSSLLFRLTDLREDATEKQLSHNVNLDETFMLNSERQEHLLNAFE